MDFRRPLVLGGFLVLCLLFLSAITVAVGTPEPTVTFENQDNETYYVTVYTVSDEDVAGYLNFEVTTDEGDRRLVTYEDLVWPGEYENVTLVDDGVDTQTFVVEPGETKHGIVTGWSQGDVTVYISERGPEREHDTSRTITCESRGQSHSLTLEESGSGSSSTCAGGFGWVFR
ncbi:hypothetical protein C488_20387 [Natrinema pellirubrum DSM 15624]|uniref:Uncharacterized protein n=1 Tax=Natrinema pellirubrum (strain DSM 15624 / CIP 106293 / JCM 10476 / NCIMB 786 / 157) TaxID=797303 RepID=L0JT32_NATP1|nr:hypothetical protein [Natrinema pellirubrum]AGB33782.1 hypothetical protein Natpe_4058 [Natrinema pellirubrum DSM 15624]ELY69231.1 hypothetical protein C488_20387 [Natrinema pellirubrum DSM 15624]